MLYSILFVVPFIPKVVQAANDWTKPCLQGVCSYDLPASTNASGSVQLVRISFLPSPEFSSHNYACVSRVPHILFQISHQLLVG